MGSRLGTNNRYFSFNKTSDDFTNDNEYDDYLELVEDLSRPMIFTAQRPLYTNVGVMKYSLTSDP
jgi:hypothetical protein